MAYNASAVSDSAIAFRKPITLQQGRALRDNPLAIREGAAGAPRILGNAIAVGSVMPPKVVSASDDYNLHAFTDINAVLGIVGTLATPSTASPPTVVGYTFTVNSATGTARFKCTHGPFSTGATSTLSLYKNGSLVSSWSETDAAGVQKSVDVSIAIGDVFEWRHRTNNGSNASVIRDAVVTADDGLTTRPPLIWASESGDP